MLQLTLIGHNTVFIWQQAGGTDSAAHFWAYTVHPFVTFLVPFIKLLGKKQEFVPQDLKKVRNLSCYVSFMYHIIDHGGL